VTKAVCWVCAENSMTCGPPANRPDLKERIAMPEKLAFSIVEHRLCRATIAARTIERP